MLHYRGGGVDLEKSAQGCTCHLFHSGMRERLNFFSDGESERGEVL